MTSESELEHSTVKYYSIFRYNITSNRLYVFLTHGKLTDFDFDISKLVSMKMEPVRSHGIKLIETANAIIQAFLFSIEMSKIRKYIWEHALTILWSRLK